MDFGIYAGDTNKTIYVRLRDSTTGLAKTGLVFNSAGAVCSYTLPLAARAAITLATQTVTGAHTDGGFVEVDATNCKGLYRLDLSDAAIASGDFTVISIEFDGIIEESVEIPLHKRKVALADNETHGGANALLRLGTSTTTPAFFVTSSSVTGPAVQFDNTSTGLGLRLSGTQMIDFGTNTLAFDITGDSEVGGDITYSGNLVVDITGNLSGQVGSVFGHTAQTGDNFLLANGANGFVAIKADTAAVPGLISASETTIVSAVQAVNTGAARYIYISTSTAYELPDSGSVLWPIEVRTFDGDGNPIAIDAAADPTMTVTRTTDAVDLSANLSAITNPATGVYRMTLSVTQGTDVVAPLRIDASGAIATVSRSTSSYPVITDTVAIDFTSADRTTLNAAATAAALVTAQNDLDKITGADGATLASAQVNYAPNKIVPDAAGVVEAAITAAQSAIIVEIDANETKIDALPTLAEILAGGDIDGYSIEETQKLLLSALTGILAGAGTSEITIQAADGSKVRITAQVDANGNRTSLVLDATG